MENESLSTLVLDYLETFVSDIVNGDITKPIINTIIVICVVIWIFFGLKIYFDAKIRYRIGIIGHIAFILFGVITGPIGLILYNLTKPRFTADELDFIKIEHKFYHHQASKVLDCITCKAYVLEGHSFCTNCGTQNRFNCSNCGHLTDFDDKYCCSCGDAFAGRKEKILKNVNPNYKAEILEVKTENTPKTDFSKVFASIKETIKNSIEKQKENSKITRSSTTDFASSSFETENTSKKIETTEKVEEELDKSVNNFNNSQNKNKKKKKKKNRN